MPGGFVMGDGGFASLLEDRMQHPLMSKREFMAFEFAKVMLGPDWELDDISEAAVALADALHAELEKGRPGETRVG